MRYFSADEIISRNREIILKTGGFTDSAGEVLNPNSLDYLIAVVEDDKTYPTLPEKAAVYTFNIITRHIFVDGCKRTGMTCAFLFLKWNDCNISDSLSNDEIVETALKIANNVMKREELSEWFKNRVIS